MALVHLRQASLAFGNDALLDQAEMSIERGDKIALVGRNGAGKSTLMRVIAGEITLDDGEFNIQQGVKVATLPQALPTDEGGTVFEQVAAGFGQVGHDLQAYYDLATQATTDEALNRLAEIQSRLESQEGWQIEQRVQATLSQLGLDPSADFAKLSGGQKRRVLLAKALVTEPDVLLLDEPTNHLDIAAIQALESTINGLRIAVLLVTHDRAFLRRVANRVLELDRGRLTNWAGGYDAFLSGKAQQEEAEARANAQQDKKLAQEETWIRQGVKARRTRNEGRVRALQQLRKERAARREKLGQAKIQIDAGANSGKRVLEAEGLSYTLPSGELLIKDFSLTLQRGDKLGLIGPNGCGKSTLLQLLLGQRALQSGQLKVGTQLNLAYFDQSREQLDETLSVQDNVAAGSDSVLVNGQPRHVLSYLQDFLFSPKRAREPISRLSGGERNRLLLAKLFAKPANFLVLDEPTNDLDIETLELLESLLVEFSGTLLVVSHDRDFIDNVVTSSLVFEGQGSVAEYVGGYSDWQRYIQQQQQSRPQSAVKNPPVTPAVSQAVKPPTKQKLSYKEQRELTELPDQIEAFERELDQLQAKMAEPRFYQQGPAPVAEATERVEWLNQQLEQALSRWEALEAKRG